MQLADVPEISGAAPFVGHARSFRSERLGFLLRAAREQPEGGRVRMFGREAFHTASPAVLHEVLVEKARLFEKSPVVRVVLYPLAGDGLFTSEGDLWKRQRRLMAPIFHPSAIARYVDIVADVVERAADRWKPGVAIDLGREMTRITMAIVGKALFDADAFDEADALGDALTVALEWSNKQLGSSRLSMQMTLRILLESAEGRLPAALERARVSLLHGLRGPILLPGARGPRLRNAIALLDDRVQRMIDERRSASTSRDDLLTRLLQARDEDGTRMDDRQVRDEAITLFVAGHETTATALTWALYRLSREPPLYSKLTMEADALGGKEDFREPERLSYAAKVFKEAMRLYPPVYLFSRRAREAVTVAGYELPRRGLVFASPYSVHRRPDVYPDPERFDPERFTPEAEALRPRCSYLPFGAGPRVCVGNHFALMEGPIVLAALARRLRFDVEGPRIEPAPFATLRPSAPVIARVHGRVGRGARQN